MLGVIESIGATFVGDGWRVFIGCVRRADRAVRAAAGPLRQRGRCVMAAPRSSRLAALVPRTRRQIARPSPSSPSLVIAALVLPYYVGEYYTLVIFQALESRRPRRGVEPARRLRRPRLAGAGGLRRARHLHGRRARQSLRPLRSRCSSSAAASSPAVFALLVSVPMFRFRGLYFAIATLVLAQALGVFMVNWNGLGGAVGLFLTSYAPSCPGHLLLLTGAGRGRDRHRRTSSCARASV